MAGDNQSPIFIQLNTVWQASLSSQTLTRDGVTGAAVLLGTAGGSGALIESVIIQPFGDVNANVVRLFRQQAGISVNRLILETAIAAVAGSTNAAAIPSTRVDLPDLLTPVGSYGLRLAPGDSLYAALGTASGVGIGITAIGGQYSAS